MREGFSIFDAHTHVGIGRHHGRRYTAEQLVAGMDRFGVDRSLVIPFPVVEDYHRAHDEIGQAVRAFPSRLVGTASLYPFIPETAFRSEVQRCAEELGFRALKLQPQYHPVNPLSSHGDFFFETALRHQLPVVVHTGAGVPFASPSLYIIPARKFSELKLVLAHCGGSVHFSEAIVAASVCPNIYLELSSLMPHHILEVLKHVPSSRLMIGSDLPESLSTELSKIFFLEVSSEVKRDILWNTANGLFGRDGE
jgi:hypothetical protein